MDKNKLISFISMGAEIAGGATGGALGLIGGPLGAIGGGAAGVVIAKGITEMAQRFLSDRERVRIAAASTFILSDIEHRLAQGDQVRNDDFFTFKQSNRSSAEELFEGVLLKCRDSFEERKIKYLSHIFENTAFNSQVSAETANQILSTAQAMSYRKYCILSFAYKNRDRQLQSFQLDTTDYRDNPSSINADKYFLFQDFYELQNYGLVVRSDNTTMLEAGDTIPALMHTTDIGQIWVEMMALDEIAIPELSFLPAICLP